MGKFNKIYDDVGMKIKKLAKVLCIVSIIASVITAIVYFVLATQYYDEAPYIFTGLGFLVLGPIFSWIGSLGIYGFGEIVDGVSTIEAISISERNSNQNEE